MKIVGLVWKKMAQSAQKVRYLMVMQPLGLENDDPKSHHYLLKLPVKTKITISRTAHGL